MEKRILTKRKDLSLMLCMFFLPFGYDFMFKTLMDLLDSYWLADLIFYAMSLIFFLNYLYYSKKLKNV